MIEKINNPLIRPVSPTERSKRTEEESEEQARTRREKESKKEDNHKNVPDEKSETRKDLGGHKKIDIRI